MVTSLQERLQNIKDWFIDTYFRRFLIWIISFLALIGVDVYLAKEVGPNIFTGVLIAIVTIAPFIYNSYVAVPILRIEVPREDDNRKPILSTDSPPCMCQDQLQIQKTDTQDIGYLRLGVRNRGFVAAEDCTFQIKITEWPNKRSDEYHAPSYEYRDWHDVTWSERDVTWTNWEKSIVIRPNDVRNANIAIMPLDKNHQACKPKSEDQDRNSQSQLEQIKAWIAKRDVFERRCTARDQDGLVVGEYKIDTQVTCRNKQRTLKELKLKIDKDWSNTDIYTAKPKE
jgi:hypothetical protein